MLQHTVCGRITPQRLEEISRYAFEQITPDCFSNPATWRDLKDILMYHPDPVVRHEASFVIGQVPIDDLVPYLVSVVKYDLSIVAKHEAVEAMGRVRGLVAGRIYRFLQRITKPGYDDEIYHPDVQATVQHALRELEANGVRS